MVEKELQSVKITNKNLVKAEHTKMHHPFPEVRTFSRYCENQNYSQFLDFLDFQLLPTGLAKEF
jgi:L-rhamnose mutarotase